MKKTLCIDIGNTRMKAAVFEGKRMLELLQPENPGTEDLAGLIGRHAVEGAIIASVGNTDNDLETMLPSNIPVLRLDSRLKFPFSIHYSTPHSLGADRLAAVAGAMDAFPRKDCLVIDAGTCITYDFITAKEEYSGGSISPGLQMRLKAMHAYTSKLPLLTFSIPAELTGNSTESSMLTGVYYGIIGEMNEMIARYSLRFASLQPLICGGDSHLFAEQLKYGIFVNPYLTLYGLNKILTFNAP